MRKGHRLAAAIGGLVMVAAGPAHGEEVSATDSGAATTAAALPQQDAPTAAVSAPQAAPAAQPPGPDYSGNLLGDMGGIRPALDKIGLSYNLLYVNQMATNVSGGDHDSLAYADMIWLSGTADLDKMIGIKGATFHVSFTKRSGDDLRAKAGMHANLLVNEVFGQGDIFRFNYAYWEQSLFNNALNIKAGRLSGSFEFFPFACNFQNLTFCAAIPSYITPNWTPFPGYTYGVVPKWNVTKNLYVQGGIYQIDSRYNDPDRAFAIGPIFKGQGSRKNFEIGWSPGTDGRKGNFRAGIFFDNVGAPDVALDDRGGFTAISGLPARQRTSQFGYYVMADQEVWSDPSGRKLTLFANFVRADKYVAKLPRIMEMGFFLKGPFAARPQDELGFAIGQVKTNRNLTNSDLALQAANLAAGRPDAGVRDKEYPMEVYYSFRPKPSLIFQPNFQYIVHPGGVKENSNEAVIGLKSVIIF